MNKNKANSNYIQSKKKKNDEYNIIVVNYKK